MFRDTSERAEPSLQRADELLGTSQQENWTMRSSRRSIASMGAVLLALALTLSACGGSDARAEDKPTTSAPTPSAPTSAATPSPAAQPLSPFEDRPQVRVVRALEAAIAKDVNARQRSLPSVVPLTTARGFDMVFEHMAKDDLDKGYHLPGPEPFTPVSVQARGGVAKVTVCLQWAGWSVDLKTGQPARKRQVSPAVMELRKVAGAWKFDRFYGGTADCGNVKVEGVRE